jgi:hypothetical protein
MISNMANNAYQEVQTSFVTLSHLFDSVFDSATSDFLLILDIHLLLKLCAKPYDWPECCSSIMRPEQYA